MRGVDRIRAIWNENQQIRFLGIGAYNTAFGYGAFSVLYFLLGGFMHYLALSTIAHFVAVTNAYLLQRIFVFKSANAWPMEFLRFNLSHLATLGTSLVALYFLVEVALLSPLPAQAIVLVLVVTASYMLHKRFSFRSAMAADGSGSRSRQSAE